VGKARGAPPGAIIKITDSDKHEQRARGKATSGNTTKPTHMLPAPVGARLTACIMTDKDTLCTEPVLVPPV
jgi:hypothetical protein